MRKYITYIFLVVFFWMISLEFRAQQTFKSQIHQFISQSNRDFQFAYLGEFVNNDSALVFFWPCIIQNELTDDQPKAVILNKEGGQWVITELIDPLSLDIKAKQQLMVRFSMKSKKQNIAIPVRDLEDSLRFSFRRIQHQLHQKNMNEFIKNVERSIVYFGAETFYFSSFFSDLIFKGVDEVDMEILEKNPQNVHANIYFRTSNHEYKVDVFLESKQKGFYIENVGLIE